MKSVGAAVLEIQLGLCRRGGKGIGRVGQGSGPKGYVIGAYYIFGDEHDIEIGH
jgi:hypothetical protein